MSEPGQGHNGVAGAELSAYIERVERVEVQIREKHFEQEFTLLKMDRTIFPHGHRGKDGRRIVSPMSRFLGFIDFDPDGCWNWEGTVIDSGYGIFNLASKAHLAHRWIVSTLRGKIPDGLVVDHLCRNRRCVNPSHLEVVTTSENVLRGMTPIVTRARMLAKTHCPHGHPYSGDNLYTFGKGYRACRTCADRRRVEWANRRAQKCQA